MRVVTAFRIVLGVLIVAAGAWRIGDQLASIIGQISREPLYGLDSPPPPGFQAYGGQLIGEMLIAFAGLAIVKQWWPALSLICWYCLAYLILGRVYQVYLDGWMGLRPAIDHVLMLALAAIILACSFAPPMDDSPARYRRIATAFTLAAAIGLIGRAAWFVTTPDFADTVDYLGGATEYPSSDYATVVTSLVSPLLAFLLVGAVTVWRHRRTVLPVALVTAACVLTGGLLQFLDVMLGSGHAEYRNLDRYVFQEGLTFLLCAAALAVLIPWRRRRNDEA